MSRSTGRSGRRGARRSPSILPRASRADARARWKKVGGWLGGALVALIVAAVAALYLVYPNSRGPGDGREVELHLPGRESASTLSIRLAQLGLVKHPKLFALYLRATGGTASVARGVHLVTDDLSPGALRERLERSPLAGRVRVTFPEGWTRFDFARRLQEKRICTLRSFLDATTDEALLAELKVPGASAEGYLFPATYDLAPDSDPREVVRRLKGEFDVRWSIAEERRGDGLADLGSSLGWGPREVVILASMVEKEAVVDDERPLIASVFVNRLRTPSFTPKLLQCDPTAGYGCLVVPEQIPSCASFTGKVTHDLVNDAANPYSTYKHEGLPPGPIANPGLRSIEAAMAPSSTRYLYFVARGEGRHTFSETYGAHNAAIRDAKQEKQERNTERAAALPRPPPVP